MESEKQTQTSKFFNSDFCIQLANRVVLKEATAAGGSNVVLSPLSFHVMLSLIAVGSGGQILHKLLHCLGSKRCDDLNSLCSQIFALIGSGAAAGDNPSAGPVLSFVNGAWIDRSFRFKPSFEAILRNVYRAERKQVDFVNKVDEVVNEVNWWAENATKGLIKQLLPSGTLDTDTALVLANALYFKGSWDQQFDKTRTTSKDFHLLNGQTVRVPFMTTKPYERHLFRSYDDYTLVKIPYQKGPPPEAGIFSMFIFLPRENNGLESLVEKFNSVPGFFNQQFELEKDDFPKFWIPKFKFSSEFEALKTMKELGLDFGDGGLTEMVDSPENKKLRLSNMFHKSYIEVNEEGTEAAASTAAGFVLLCGRYPIPTFVADHPFLFMLREETSRAVFFIGAVLNPQLTA